MHPRIIPYAFPGNIVPTAAFAGERSSPLRANALLFDIVPKAALPDAPGGASLLPLLFTLHCSLFT